MTDILSLIDTDLPRQIRGIEVNDPILTLFGDDWGLTITCPWEVTGPGVDFTWLSDSIEDAAWELIGRELVAVSSDNGELIDPVFEISGEIVIKVHADTDLEPWTLRLPHVFFAGRKTSDF